MGKNIVICCDGTANEFAKDRTNVIKLYYCLEKESSRQVAFYHPGIGTMEPSGALTTLTRKITRMCGVAFGYGLAADVRDTYQFLVDQYDPGDTVFLFGFSRGSYTVRVVCSLLKMYGLIQRGNSPLIPYAIRMMMAIEKINSRKRSMQKATPKEDEALKSYFLLSDEFKNIMSRCMCKPNFVGLWDTVSSVGWISTPLRVPFTTDNPDIEVGRHAISIDERRAFFRSNRWINSPYTREHGPKDLKQVWFAGVHCDVGGGYPEAEGGLSKFPLEWMLEEAKAKGLLIDADRQEEVMGRSAGSRYIQAIADAKEHESLKGWWKLAEWIPKPHYDFRTGKTGIQMNRGKQRTVPPKSFVHESVFRRFNGEYAKQLPSDAVPVATEYFQKPRIGAAGN